MVDRETAWQVHKQQYPRTSVRKHSFDAGWQSGLKTVETVRGVKLQALHAAYSEFERTRELPELARAVGNILDRRDND